MTNTEAVIQRYVAETKINPFGPEATFPHTSFYSYLT